MTILLSWIGIDVSKHHLDVFDAGRTLGIANDTEGVARLVDGLAGRQVRVVFEATGTYDGALRRGLTAAGIPFVRVNPRRARAFADAAGFLAKTDRVDARMLAAMGQAMPAPPTAVEHPQRRRLADLHKRRDQLVAMRKQERTRLAEAAGELRAGLQDHIAWLSRAIVEIERTCRALIGSCPDLRRVHDLIRSVPGCGPVAATTLIALMPELGERSPKTIAALGGLAPFNLDSGQRRGKRRIRHGRRRIREALYMSAVTAARFSPRFQASYQALLAAGKPPKLALIALARKLLVVLNAVLRTRTPFHT